MILSVSRDVYNTVDVREVKPGKKLCDVLYLSHRDTKKAQYKKAQSQKERQHPKKH